MEKDTSKEKSENKNILMENILMENILTKNILTKKKFPEAKFTQLLYRLNDSIGAFVIALLKRKDLEELLFWASEIILSGYAVRFYKLLVNIYFDFYAIDYPKFEKFMVKNIIQYEKTKNPASLFLIAVNLFHKRNRTPYLFHYGHVEMGKEPKYLNKTLSPFLKKLNLDIGVDGGFGGEGGGGGGGGCVDPLKEKFLVHLHAFHKKKTNTSWLRIIALTRQVFDEHGSKYIYDLLGNYFKRCRTHPIYSDLPENIHIFKSNFVNARSEKENVLSCVLVNLFHDLGFKEENTSPNTRNIGKMSDELTIYLQQIRLPEIYYSDTFHPSSATPEQKQILDENEKAYGIIDKYRRYCIPEEITCFRSFYAPFKPGRLTHEFKRLNDKWMYYCHMVPFWKKKFDLYEYDLNHKRKLLSFYSEDDFEEFSLWFNYEPDECGDASKFKSLVWYKNKNTTDNLKIRNNVSNITKHLKHTLDKNKMTQKTMDKIQNKHNGIAEFLK